MMEYGTRRMWVGKLGEAQTKLNKLALKRGRLKAMLRAEKVYKLYLAGNKKGER